MDEFGSEVELSKVDHAVDLRILCLRCCRKQCFSIGFMEGRPINTSALFPLIVGSLMQVFILSILVTSCARSFSAAALSLKLNLLDGAKSVSITLTAACTWSLRPSMMLAAALGDRYVLFSASRSLSKSTCLVKSASRLVAVAFSLSKNLFLSKKNFCKNFMSA